MPKIDLDQNIQDIFTINLSSIAKKIEYLPLEAHSPLGQIRGIIKFQNTISVYGLDFYKTYDNNGVFDPERCLLDYTREEFMKCWYSADLLFLYTLFIIKNKSKLRGGSFLNISFYF